MIADFWTSLLFIILLLFMCNYCYILDIDDCASKLARMGAYVLMGSASIAALAQVALVGSIANKVRLI